MAQRAARVDPRPENVDQRISATQVPFASAGRQRAMPPLSSFSSARLLPNYPDEDMTINHLPARPCVHLIPRKGESHLHGQVLAILSVHSTASEHALAPRASQRHRPRPLRPSRGPPVLRARHPRLPEADGAPLPGLDLGHPSQHPITPSHDAPLPPTSGTRAARGDAGGAALQRWLCPWSAAQRVGRPCPRSSVCSTTLHAQANWHPRSSSGAPPHQLGQGGTPGAVVTARVRPPPGGWPPAGRERPLRPSDPALPVPRA
jgi:hypothetical protein